MTEPVQRARNHQEKEGAAGSATRRTEPLCRLDRTAGDPARVREKAKEQAVEGSNINIKLRIKDVIVCKDLIE